MATVGPFTLLLDKCNPRCNPANEDSVMVLDVGGRHQTAQDTNGVQLWKQIQRTQTLIPKHNIYVIHQIILHVNLPQYLHKH